jgi:hypothetical protein
MGGITVPPREPTSFATCYRLLDSLISLRMPDEQTAAQIHPMLRHLTMSGDTVPDLDLEVRRAAEGYLLLRDGVPIDNCHSAAGLLPMIHANLLMLAYDQSTRLVGIHSAAVKSGNCCLLLPALPGSGKSTLAAALLGSGFDYCADDLVLFNGVPTGLRSAPVAMGIKTGSWKPLMDYHSDLAALPISERVDGQHIRYLPPPPGRLADVTRPLVVSHVVFPRYREGSAARLTPISAAEGLWRLTEAGYDVQGRLTAAVVEQLIDWIAPIPCFEFRYGELPEAVTTVRRLCT